MNIRIITLALAVFGAMLFAQADISVAQVTNGDDDVSFQAPVTVESNTSASSGTVSNGGDDAPVSAPVSSGGSVVGSGGSVTNGGDDVGTVTPVSVPSTPSTPSTPVTPVGGSGSIGGGRVIPVVTNAVISTTSCPLINSYMKLGWKNDAKDVAKLQAFLKNTEGLDVAVTGTFDEKTHAAVVAFQRKHLNLTMGPWSATKPSGFVYITTAKVINQIACKQPLTLTPAEVAIISEYVSRGSSAPAQVGTDTVGITVPITLTAVDSDKTDSVGTKVSGSNSNSDSDSDSDSDSGLEAAAGSSVAARFWGFLSGLFTKMFR